VSAFRHADDRGRPARVLAPTPSAKASRLAEPPTFSIIIPAYQAADTVAASARSALEQTHPAHEVIVVDDGSTDDIEGALRQFGERISLIKKQNGGGASALNAGAEAASGDFIAILDADDAYHPQRLEALAELARDRPDLDLITTDARFVVKGEEVGSFAAHTPFVVEDQRTAIFESCFVGGWPSVRLARLREIGGFDETLRTGYDWDCWARLILDGSQAGLVDETYYDYRLHAGSLTSSRASSLWDRVRLLEKAAANPALRPEERPGVERHLRMHRSRAVVAEAQAALYGSAPSAPLLRLAFSGGIEPRARLAAILAALAPPLARRVVPEDRPAEERLSASRS
jgi:Glycosyl transferase family 2